MAPITNVDRDRLYTDLMYRYEYVSTFVGFDKADVAAIKAAAPYIGPLVPAIVDAMYNHTFSFDITKKVFLQKGEGFHGPISTSLDALSTNDAHIQFRKRFMAKYLVKLLTAEYDAHFIAYLDYVGRIHTDTPTKKSKINVEYIHLNALMGWLQAHLLALVETIPRFQEDSKLRAETKGALSKLLWIQNDFFVMYYLRDSEVFRGHGNPEKVPGVAPVYLVEKPGVFALTMASVAAVSVLVTLHFIKR
ncbi:hypothetical protein CcCBS67573_g04554 [Chytriomyces confervae]|uniref:Globin-sensor domain-containing protein n=1 Tax=Chytriomyces confervae TaxID=246404 RepID=A0A507FD04_9FUNG|nr:hypothetical protein HDU80_005852 [Chytriomyces hyalinus]TPX74173.1 hypothetical protein CcCBS67573_g04554 [Chytriomyces confervae]